MIDPTALKPVRHSYLQHDRNHGICVSKQWFVAVDWQSNITVYSLPDLQLRHWVQLSCHWHPRADSAGVIYLPYFGFVTMIEISDNGNVTVLGRLSAGGFRQSLISVAIGPQSQLYIAHRFSAHFYLVNTTSDTIIHTLTLPAEINDVTGIAALTSGQVLVINDGEYWGKIAVYPSAFEPAELLTDVPFARSWMSLTGNANQFLISLWKISQLIIIDDKGGWQAVRALNGVDGVWVPCIQDVAVWEDCVWVSSDFGSVILLCPL